LNIEKLVSVMILEDTHTESSILSTLISEKGGLKLEGVMDASVYTDRNKSKPGGDIWIVNINSSRQNAKKLISLLPYNDIKIIITSFLDLAFEAYTVGAMDYILKPVQKERFYQAMDRAIAYSLSPYRPVDRYSQLEKNNMFYNILQNEYRISDPCCEICKLILTGKTRAEISKLMRISENTLKVYLREIYSRTIEKEYDNPSLGRSKFHLLYMFLNKMYNSL
jgi:DNA-binding NarL/FixJ family response regulator